MNHKKNENSNTKSYRSNAAVLNYVRLEIQ